MMHDFLTDNRQNLVDRCRAKVAQRPGRAATGDQLHHGIPIFLDQLIRTLKTEQSPEPMESREISGPSGGALSSSSEMGKSAALHGRELLQLGYSIDEVVHDYGDLCQAITDLAHEVDAPVQVDEFRTLNRCLDNAIADAVMEFTYQRESLLANEETEAVNERLRILGRELRSDLGTAILAFAAARAGNLSFTGATGTILEGKLVALRDLVDHSFAEILNTTESPTKLQIFSVDDFVAEVKLILGPDARESGCELAVLTVDKGLAVNVDREMLFSAVKDLLQYAFSLTHSGGEVTLNAYALADRIQIDVEDRGKSVPQSDLENSLLPTGRVGDYTGDGGRRLSIIRRNVELNEGTLDVLDMSGRGRIFSICLPRYSNEAGSPAKGLAIGF
jgi:signal transduction histidine kinase